MLQLKDLAAQLEATYTSSPVAWDRDAPVHTRDKPAHPWSVEAHAARPRRVDVDLLLRRRWEIRGTHTDCTPLVRW